MSPRRTCSLVLNALYSPGLGIGPTSGVDPRGASVGGRRICLKRNVSGARSARLRCGLVSDRAGLMADAIRSGYSSRRPAFRLFP